MRSVPTVVCELRRSRLEAALIVLLSVAALGAPWLSPLPPWLRLALTGLALGFGSWSWRLRARRDYARVALAGDGRVQLLDAAGVQESLEFRNAVLLGPLLVLELRRENGKGLHLALFRDSLVGDDWRRLRVLLRHGLHADGPPPVIR
jgi:hypothetical protein